MLALLAIIFIILTGISMLVFLSVIAVYNRLAGFRGAVKSSWSDINARHRERYDLVSNLVETIKGHAPQKKSLFESVCRAMSSARKASAPADKAKAENMFNETLKGLFAVTKEYPELKVDANFRQLRARIEELKDNIEEARRNFNSVVRDYNTMIETFPSNIIASLLKFEKEEFFGLEEPRG